MTIRQIWNWIIEQAAGIADVATFQLNWLDAPIGSVIGAVILYSTVVWSFWLQDATPYNAHYLAAHEVESGD